MHLFLVLVQQHELGSFQLVNRLWKWSKLRYFLAIHVSYHSSFFFFSFLANLVDQIRIIQQHYVYNFQKNEEVADTLMQRIDSFKDNDLMVLAENCSRNIFHPKLNAPNIVTTNKKSSSSNSLANKYQRSTTPENNNNKLQQQQFYKRDNFNKT